MADANDQGESVWRWVGMVSAVLAIAAFFGIHNFTQLKDTLSGSASNSGPTSNASPSPTCNQVQSALGACGVHFRSPGGWKKTGTCDATRCPLSETFENDGKATGSGTVTFSIHAGNGFGAITGSSCTAVIQSTPPKGVTTASCTIYSPNYGSESTYGISDDVRSAN